MRFRMVILFLILVLVVAFLGWVFWPPATVTFGKEEVPLSEGDQKVNSLMDSLYLFSLGNGKEELVATLMEFRSDSAAGEAFLYIHGLGDYFFHPHVARWFTDRGIHFYALDLRRYGRSLRPGSPPNLVADYGDYFEEIDRALARMEQAGHSRIGLLGHSNGGLVSSLYAARGGRREQLDVLILNSPFLQFNVSAAGRAFLPVAAWIGRMNPRKLLRGTGDPAYSYSIHEDYYGEWSYNTDWKPLEGFPIFAGWINAAYRAQREVAGGLDLAMPVLVLHSDSTYRYEQGPGYAPAMQRMDAILDVDHIRQRAVQLGSRVEIRPVSDAMHDVFLSAPPVRENAFSAMEEWLDRHFQEDGG